MIGCANEVSNFDVFIGLMLGVDFIYPCVVSGEYCVLRQANVIEVSL